MLAPGRLSEIKDWGAPQPKECFLRCVPAPRRARLVLDLSHVGHQGEDLIVGKQTA